MNKQILITIILYIKINTVLSQSFNTIKYSKEIPKVNIILPPTKAIKIDTALTVSKETKDTTIRISLPLDSILIVSRFGKRIDPINGKLEKHRGLDLTASNQPVKTIMDGIVKNSGFEKKLGLYVEVDHGDISSIYAHLSEAQVQEGQELKAGEIIGITGSSGRTTGEHLHFAIKEGRQLIDPAPLLEFISKNR